MRFFPRLPLLFYLGLLPVVILLWLWADSTAQETTWQRQPDADQLEMLSMSRSALRFERRIITRGPGVAPLMSSSGPMGKLEWRPLKPLWKGPKPARRIATKFGPGEEDTLFPAPRVDRDVYEFGRGSSMATDWRVLPFWQILLVYLPPWLALSAWRAQRQRRKWAAVSPEPWPASRLGTFLRRFPPLFYVGLLPAALLFLLWVDSVGSVFTWEATPSWAHGYGIAAEGSTLHLRHEWVMGEMPADVESYGWHGLWQKRGAGGNFDREPKEDDESSAAGSASAAGTLGLWAPLFPGFASTLEERKEKYVSVATRRVALPFWMILLGWLPLWLGASWWQARRRKKKRELLE